MVRLIAVLLVIFIERYSGVHCAALSILSKYEIIQSGATQRKLVKRGLAGVDTGSYNRIESFTFRAYDRDFTLYLTPSYRHVLAGDFVAAAQDSKGDTVPVAVPMHEFYSGHVFGERSNVSAHLGEDGLLTASIITNDQTYIIEPAWRHIPDSPANASIIYRVSDMIDTEENALMCGYVQVTPDLMVNSTYFDSDDAFRDEDFSTERRRRAADSGDLKNRCSLKLVADYLFYKNLAGSSVAEAVKYLIALIGRVNQIYTSTVWRDDDKDEGLTNMGFVIKSIIVHTEFTDVHPLSPHYNMKDYKPTTANELLRLFSIQEGSRQGSYCLVHLFTYRQLEKGILGLGYIASPKLGTGGGLCSSSMRINDGTSNEFYGNTALSSGLSSRGDTVVVREADLVTAHELGHNWGSFHDMNDQCTPSTKDGGKYLMFGFSVNGYEPNNKGESATCACYECSKTLIEEASYFCGNLFVEAPEEECDAGLIGSGASDKCCTSDCKLNKLVNAVCSPQNQPCCGSDCRAKPAGTPCPTVANNACKMPPVCDGVSFECLTPLQRDGEPCFDDGECMNGICMNFCQKQSIGMEPCMCETELDSCKRCCSNGNGSCAPYIANGSWSLLPSGSRCIYGSCDEWGKCQHEVQDFMSHFWDIIEKLDGNSFLRFMHDNIVGTIVIISLIFWIPASILVHKIDQKRQAVMKQRVVWATSDSLVSDQNRIQVVRDVKRLPGPVSYYPSMSNV